MNQKKILNKSIENIYSLTPLQEGMLFHALGDADSTGYILQSTFCLNFSVNVDALREAVNALSKRYDALRTSIVYAGMSKPRQVVLKERFPEFSAQTGDEAVLCAVCEEEIRRGFDLQKEPLLRFRCVKLAENAYRLVWTMHHIIVDGWCMSLLYADLMRYYRLIESGCETLDRMIERERLENSEYAAYVKWLEKQNADDGLRFWENYLADYDASLTVSPTARPQKTDCQMLKHTVCIKDEATAAISELKRISHVTESTLLQSAWGIVLQRYNNCTDAVFGKVVSGRNAPIKGIERMIGLFANTIPARVQTKTGETITDFLQRNQHENNEAEEITYCSLAEIQRKVGRDNLIRTLFAFENYYVDSSEEVAQENSREQTNYDITVSACRDQSGITIDFLYDPNVYTQDNISHIASHYRNVIEFMALHPNAAVETIKCAAEDEERIILDKFNATGSEYPKDKTVTELLERQVLLRPEAQALVFGEKVLSYREMNERINALAWRLREMGVRART